MNGKALSFASVVSAVSLQPWRMEAWWEINFQLIKLTETLLWQVSNETRKLTDFRHRAKGISFAASLFQASHPPPLPPTPLSTTRKQKVVWKEYAWHRTMICLYAVMERLPKYGNGTKIRYHQVGDKETVRFRLKSTVVSSHETMNTPSPKDI